MILNSVQVPTSMCNKTLHYSLGYVGRLMVISLVLWKYSIAQCFYSEELISKLDANQRLDIDINLGELSTKLLTISAELSKAEPTCTTTSMTSREKMRICLMENLSTCQQNEALFEAENLDYSQYTELAFKKSPWVSNLIATAGFKNCFYTIKGKPTVQNKNMCKLLLDTTADHLTIPNSFDTAADNVQRLAILDNEMVSISENFDGQVICKETNQVLAALSLSRLILNKISPLYTKINQVLEIIGSSFSKDLIDQFEVCSGDAFLFGNYSIKMTNCILEHSVKTTAKRLKRSTLLSYLFSDGKTVDDLTNSIHDMSEVLNNNIHAISENQKNLKIVEDINSQEIAKLEKVVKYSGYEEAAIFWFISTQVKAEKNYLLAQTNNLVLLSDITTAEDYVHDIADLLVPVLRHQPAQYCTLFGSLHACINTPTSSVQITKRTGEMRLELNIQNIRSGTAAFVSCVPQFESKEISIFHNKHAAFVTPLEIQIDNFLIEIKDLENKDIIQSHLRKVESSDLLLDNILITRNGDKLGFSCVAPEILYFDSQRLNCTSKISWVQKSSADILSAKGQVNQHQMYQFQLTSKNAFMKQKIDDHVDQSMLEKLVQTSTNFSIHEIILKKVSALTPVEATGVSLGFGAGLISIVLMCIFCYKVMKCRGNPPVTQTSQAERAPLSAEEVNSRTVDILGEYLGRLRTRKAPTASPDQ